MMDGYCGCGCGQKTGIAEKTRAETGWVKGQPKRFVHGHHNRVPTAETRRKNSEAQKGKTRSPETRAKMSAAKRGSRHPQYGKRGEETNRWKGDAVGYTALHDWVRANKTKTGICTRCGRSGRKTHWANLSHEYRRDLDDFAEMCQPCHWAYDGMSGMPRNERHNSQAYI